MADLFSSDPHFGHQLVAAERGFGTTEEHDDAVLDSYRKAVRPSDTLWLLGDLDRGSDTDHSLALLAQLDCSKVLILGNHCAAHPLHRRARTKFRHYLDVFDWVTPFASVKTNGTELLLSHFPYEGDHPDREDRHVQWRLRDLGAPLVHGHTHQLDPWVPERPNQVCVSWDAWRRPATLHELNLLLGVEPAIAGKSAVEKLRRELRILPDGFGADPAVGR